MPRTMSLFQICLDFLASNIDLLDSLCGFPDTVGKEIFEYVAGRGCFEDPLKRSRVLQVFSDAYGDCGFLDSLSLQTCHIFLNDILDEPSTLWIFQSLLHLDLGGCGLGDDHDILTLIGKLERLETLILADNGLSDDGVRRLTARARMFPQSKPALSYLDLSDNKEITLRSLEYSQKFAALSIMRVSNTSLSLKALTDQSAKYRKWSVCWCESAKVTVHTQGWAAQVMESWLGQYDRDRTQVTKGHLEVQSDYAATSLVSHVRTFYSKRRPVPSDSRTVQPPTQPSLEVFLTANKCIKCQLSTMNRSLQNSSESRDKILLDQASNPLKRTQKNSYKDYYFCASRQNSKSPPKHSQKHFFNSPRKKKQRVCDSDLIHQSIHSSGKDGACFKPVQYGINNENDNCDFKDTNNQCDGNSENKTSDWLIAQYTQHDPPTKTNKSSVLDALNKWDSLI